MNISAIGVVHLWLYRQRTVGSTLQDLVLSRYLYSSFAAYSQSATRKVFLHVEIELCDGTTVSISAMRDGISAAAGRGEWPLGAVGPGQADDHGECRV